MINMVRAWEWGAPRTRRRRPAPVDPDKVTLRSDRTPGFPLQWVVYSPRPVHGLQGIQLTYGRLNGMWRYHFHSYTNAYNVVFGPKDRE